jgi:hypothetical protein
VFVLWLYRIAGDASERASLPQAAAERGAVDCGNRRAGRARGPRPSPLRSALQISFGEQRVLVPGNWAVAHNW